MAEFGLLITRLRTWSRAALSRAAVLSIIAALVEVIGMVALVPLVTLAMKGRPGWLSRALGAVFGLVRGVLLLLVATVLIQLLGMAHQAWWQEAQGPVWLDVLLNGIKPVLPDALRAYLPH